MEKSFLDNYYIAHRGLHNKEFPENSLGAFSNAITHNYAIELDIHLLEDETIVVFHDTNLKRMCNVDKKLYDLKGEDLKSYHLSQSKYTIPTLQNVLDLVKGQVPLLIEIKDMTHYKKLCPILMNTLKNYTGEYAIQSFNPLALRKCYKLNSNIPYGYLCSKLEDEKLINSKILKTLLYNLAFYKISKASYIMPKYDEITPKIIRVSKGNLIPWVIKNEEQKNMLKKVSKSIIFEDFLPKK